MMWEYTVDEAPGHHMASYTHTFTPKEQFRVVNQPTGVLGDRKKPENLEETQIGTERTCETPSSMLRIKLGNLDL